MVVLDEVVGTFVTFIFIIPRLKSMFIGACLFRFFDITKWFGISRLQKYHGAKGILIDDIASGIFANILLRGLLAYGYI
jgi:phosphatidylglycerophosphatase A